MIVNGYPFNMNDFAGDACENFSSGATRGGSHENDRNLVGHPPTSDSVAGGHPNPNPPQRRPSLEMTTSSGCRRPSHSKSNPIRLPFVSIFDLIFNFTLVYVIDVNGVFGSSFADYAGRRTSDDCTGSDCGRLGEEKNGGKGNWGDRMWGFPKFPSYLHLTIGRSHPNLSTSNGAAVLPHLWLNATPSFSDPTQAYYMKSFCHLPKEVLEVIFLRVPPKSLKSFKRVCKSWYAIINDQSFIDKQLHNSIDNKYSPYVTFCLNWTRQDVSSLEKIRVLSVITIHDNDRGDGEHLPCVIEEMSLPPTPEIEKHIFQKETFVLCNPELGEFKLLHTPCLDPEFMFSGAGFGYDPKATDYKCFKLFGSVRDEKVSRALVYTLGTDSWREVKIDLNHCCYVKAGGVYCRGVYYWWNMGSSNSKQMVLSFDLSEEEFHKIQIPEHAQDPRIKVSRLALWNKSVVFFISTEYSEHSTSFEMWLMADNSSGVEGDGRFGSYNLRSQKFRKLPMDGMVGPAGSHAYLFQESSFNQEKVDA
ncbi:hypothetical protein TIFTF001_007925 [Ficus carica]|uniref:F-box domain-containing protein n=1 Tax=Ficus carica TaxID=3494 RepID=A0AA88D2F5_FICCA|nr:hypothetical protein TIFTF001_007925 [Ficus carica]